MQFSLNSLYPVENGHFTPPSKTPFLIYTDESHMFSESLQL